MNRNFLIHWLVLAVALALTAYILPGVHVASVGSLLVAALVLGFVNAVLKPLLVLLTLPLTVMTLGIFYLVLNGILFALGSVLVPGFSVDGIGWAMLGAILMSLISAFIGRPARGARRPLSAAASPTCTRRVAMLYLQFAFLLLMLYLGSRYGGIGLGVISGIGLRDRGLRVPGCPPPARRSR